MPIQALTAPLEVQVIVTSAVLDSSGQAAVPGATKLVNCGPAGVVSVGSGLGSGVGDGLGVGLAEAVGEADSDGDSDIEAVGVALREAAGSLGPRLVSSAAMIENSNTASKPMARPIATRTARLRSGGASETALVAALAGATTGGMS